MAEAASGYHRNKTAAGRNQRRQHKADFVTDTAGGVFIDNRAVQFRPGQDVSGIAHGQSQSGCFFFGHAVEKNGHCQGGGLGIDNGAVGHAADKFVDFIRCQGLTIAFFADNFLR